VQGHQGANAIAANLRPVGDLLRLAARRGGLDALRTLLGPPEWRPVSEGGPQPVPQPQPALRWDPRPPTGIVAYAGAWMLLTSLALTGILLAQAELPPLWQGLAAAMLLWTVGAWGGLLDQRPWAPPAEALRLLVLPLALLPVDPRLALLAALLSLGSGLVLWRATARALASG
jgi:alkylglycerol monooxygenase